MLTLILDGERYQPDESTRVVWFPGEIPGVTALWQAGRISVIERFWTSIDEPVLVREITFESKNPLKTAELEVSLYGNPALFSEFLGNSYGLSARGYDAVLVSTHAEGVFHERTLTVPLYRDDNMHLDGTIYRMLIMYSLGPDMPRVGTGELSENEKDYWVNACIRWTEPHPHKLHHEIERVFTASAMGLRAAVANDGRFDASIWQYGYEWAGDASKVAEALVYSGQFEVARSVLENILTRMTIPEGMAMESSRFRGGQDAELNNNGEILKACRTYLDWTGDRDFIEVYYERIAAIANYLLRAEFLHEETGMLMASRDIWERNAEVGILPGFDIAHQTFGILGLRDAAHIANLFSRFDDVERWTAAGKKMRQSFLQHPSLSMIENNRIIKRRLFDGSIQTELAIAQFGSEFQKQFVPDGMPLASGVPKSWEPDISECFPIALGVIDPRSGIARNTIEAMDLLWSQAWDDGGYGRYNIQSEPDSPGPWPLATMYVAAACLEAGDVERAQRAIGWLIDRAGAGGCWLEFYGNRPTPPLPPTGTLVWAWAQWITLVVKHLLGAQVKDDQLTIRPRLGGFFGELRFRDSSRPIPE